MSDQELLELAAKAAGLDYDHEDGYISYGEAVMRWNPLVNDGAALRLAVKLGFVINNRHSEVLVEGINEQRTWQAHDGNEVAATRRAIVRAAAEIGKAMTKE